MSNVGHILKLASLAAVLLAAPVSAGIVCAPGVKPPFASDVAARIYFTGFVDTIFGRTADDRRLAGYFDAGYHARLNGVSMNLQQEQAHFAAVRAGARDIRYSYGRVIATCDGLVEQHQVDIEGYDGRIQNLHAMSFMAMAHGKIVLIDEVAGSPAP